MSNRLTAKQENFCQAIVDGLNQSDAYRHAYEAARMLPATIANNAYMLMQNSDIAARVQGLRDQVTAGKAWTFEQGMEEVETNIRLSRFLGQMGPARAATKDGLEMSGLLEAPKPGADIKITKVTVILNHGNRRRDNLDDDRSVVEGSSHVLPPDPE